MEIKAYMSKKSKLVIIYCMICTVLFIAVFTLVSYTGKLPQSWVAAVFTALYCVITASGAFLILKFGGPSSPADPPKGLRPDQNLFRQMKTPAATETLSDCTSPTIGNEALTSDILSSSLDMPVSSAPIINNVGFLKSTVRYDTEPFSVAAHICISYWRAKFTTVFKFVSLHIGNRSNAPEELLMASSLT